MTKHGFILLALTGACLAEPKKPHPQLTYGSIKFLGERRSECLPRWIEDEAGNLVFKACSDGKSLYEVLGRMEEDDPLYETKKAALIEAIRFMRKR